MRRFMLQLLALVAAVPLALSAQRAPARVTLVLDRPSARYGSMLADLQHEIGSFFAAGEIVLAAPVAGDGTVSGIGAALDSALADPSVAVVVALGVIGSDLLAHRGPLPKPAIAASIADPAWQGLGGRASSGVANLVYVDQAAPVTTALTEFHHLVGYHRIALIVDADLGAALPAIVRGAEAVVRSLGAQAVVVKASTAAEPVLGALPADADAAYLAPLPAMDAGQYQALLRGLTARKIPTVSQYAGADLAAGALVSYEAAESWQRLARRVAVDLQRILAGEPASSLPVRLLGGHQLTLNLTTAAAIGFTPGRSLLTDATLIGTAADAPADTLTFATALRAAAELNLDLLAGRLGVASGQEEVRSARATLLPRVESRIGQTFTRSATAAASFGQQPERLTEGTLSFGLPLYSERAWAGYRSEALRQHAREADLVATRLDVVLDAAAGYLTLRRARTVAEVRRTTLQRSRANLEVARLRDRAGSASPADVYRWEGEVANARRDLIAAEAQVRVAALDLARVLNRPLERPYAEQAVAPEQDAILAADSTVLAWFDHPIRFAALTGFLIDEASRNAPELVRADAAIAAQRRLETAAGRAFWLPDLTLEGGLNNVFHRGGAGSTAPELPMSAGLTAAPDQSWQVRLEASIPVFTGGSRKADRAQATFERERLEIQRRSAERAVEQRVRATMESAAASYAALALTRDAARAAGRNYDLVSDGYSRGAMSITALIDAQTAARNADESAANAVHDFLLDLMRVERATGSFAVLQTDTQRNALLERLRSLRTP